MGSHVTDCENCSPPKVISGRFSGFVCGQERASSIMAAGKLYVSRRVFLSLQLTCEKTIWCGRWWKKIHPSSFLHLAFGQRKKDLKVRAILTVWQADQQLIGNLSWFTIDDGWPQAALSLYKGKQGKLHWNVLLLLDTKMWWNYFLMLVPAKRRCKSILKRLKMLKESCLFSSFCTYRSL